MSIDAKNYSIAVCYGLFDGEECFEARVSELPDLVEYADSHEEAYNLAIDAIETTAVIMSQKGKSMPLPRRRVDNYSGRVTLRLPKTLHRYLAVRAEYEDVSLNALITSALSAFSSSEGEWENIAGTWIASPSAGHSSTIRFDNIIPLRSYPQDDVANAC